MLFAVLNQIWAKETSYLEARVGPYPLLSSSFHTLKDGCYVGDEVGTEFRKDRDRWGLSAKTPQLQPTPLCEAPLEYTSLQDKDQNID